MGINLETSFEQFLKEMRTMSHQSAEANGVEAQEAEADEVGAAGGLFCWSLRRNPAKCAGVGGDRCPCTCYKVCEDAIKSAKGFKDKQLKPLERSCREFSKTHKTPHACDDDHAS